MEIVQYQPKDLETINFWLSVRGIEEVEPSDMPEIGFMVPTVAAGFLRRAEGNFAWLDGLVTNPIMPSEIRHQAIELVVEKLIEIAKQLKIKGLLAHSSDISTLKRSEKHGFQKMPDTLIIKDLRGV